MSADTRAYIAVCPECGRLVAAMTNDCPDKAKEVAKWMRAGLSVDRATNDEVRSRPWTHTAECQFAPRKAPRAKTVTTQA